jgi:hypothetical protein
MPTPADLNRLTLDELEAIEADPDNSDELCAAARDLKAWLLQQQAAGSFEHFQAGTNAFRQLADRLRQIASAATPDPAAGVVKRIDKIIAGVGDFALSKAGIVADPARGIAEDTAPNSADLISSAQPPAPSAGSTATLPDSGPAVVSSSTELRNLESEYIALFQGARISPHTSIRCGASAAFSR